MLIETIKRRIIQCMNQAPIIISQAALLARLNDRAGLRAVDCRYIKRGDLDVLMIYYDNGDVREFKGLKAA